MSSEEVLLIVKNVKLKKSEGRLYMMGSRMAWMQASSDTFAVSHYYADIRGKAIRRSKKIFVFQVTLSTFFGSVRREKVFL